MSIITRWTVYSRSLLWVFEFRRWSREETQLNGGVIPRSFRTAIVFSTVGALVHVCAVCAKEDQHNCLRYR